MLDNGSEPSFPLPLANIFRKTLMNSVIKLVNHVPFCLQYQMLYGVGGRTLPVKKAYVFHPVGELYSAPDLFSAASSVQRICGESAGETNHRFCLLCNKEQPLSPFWGIWTWLICRPSGRKRVRKAENGAQISATSHHLTTKWYFPCAGNWISVFRSKTV